MRRFSPILCFYAIPEYTVARFGPRRKKMDRPCLEDYRKLEKLGEGSFGVVHKARHVQTGEWVALKTMSLENENEGVPYTSLREIAVLRMLRHPNIIE